MLYVRVVLVNRPSFANARFLTYSSRTIYVIEGMTANTRIDCLIVLSSSIG